MTVDIDALNDLTNKIMLPGLMATEAGQQVLSDYVAQLTKMIGQMQTDLADVQTRLKFIESENILTVS